MATAPPTRIRRDDRVAAAPALPDVLVARAETRPDDRFVSFVDEHVTFAGALRRAEAAAAALEGLGVGRGTKVAIMLPNCLEILDLWFGCTLLGAVFVPLNVALKGDGLAHVLGHSEAEVVVAEPSLVPVVDAALARLAPRGPRVRLVRGDAGEGWRALAPCLAAGAGGSYTRARVARGDLASILYTSGTTGMPKGVMNGHHAFVAAGRVFAHDMVEVRGDDVFFTTLPLFHVNAQMLTTMGALVSGRPMVLAPRFSASGFFDELRRSGATVFNYIGAMLTMLFKQPERADDAGGPARLAVGGAAPAALWRAFEERFGVRILEAYGLTETACVCLASPPADVRVGKLGVPVAWADVAVHREDGTEAAPGEPGEIVIRAKEPDTLFSGYHRDPDATARAMAGGWFHSGDRGRRDEDGYFVFIDRLKDAIRRRGENISSHEVEQVVNGHPAVAESAAVGVPSDLGEEDVLVAVVPRPGRTVDPAELVAFCAERMAGFMTPRYVRVLDALPKTATQRVQKYALREAGTTGAWDRERTTHQEEDR